MLAHFQGPLPFDSPKKKREFLFHLLLRKSKINTHPQTGVRARRLRTLLFTEAARSPFLPKQSAVISKTQDALGQEKSAISLSAATAHDLIDLAFSDLPLEQKVTGLPEDLSSEDLSLNANLYLIQGLISRSAWVQIQAFGNVRRIIRQAKLRRLICQISPIHSSDGSMSKAPPFQNLKMEISGPLSLFGHTSIYGRALAELVPMLYWCNRFHLQAHCKVQNRQGIVEVSSRDPIMPSQEPRIFDSQLEARFFRGFLKHFPEWDLIREPEPIQLLGTHAKLIFPDFKIQNRTEPHRWWYLEIVGFWTPDYLRKKAEQLKRVVLKNMILLVDEKLVCKEDYLTLPTMIPVVFFRQTIRTEQLEQLGRILGA